MELAEELSAWLAREEEAEGEMRRWWWIDEEMEREKGNECRIELFMIMTIHHKLVARSSINN